MHISLGSHEQSTCRPGCDHRRAHTGRNIAGRAVGLFALATLGAAGVTGATAQKVWVATAAELQAAVADPANAGKRIVLTPNPTGYLLSPAGPTMGRLELQTDMELEGVPGDSSAVVIDASLLPATSYQAGGLTGALRMGRGHNAVRWLTLRNAVNGAAFIETDLAPTVPDADTSVTVERCIIEGNQRGIDFRLLGTAASARTLTGFFKGNVLRANTIGQGQGLRIAILQGVMGATLRATIEGSSSEGNRAGLLAASNHSGGNTIAIDSTANSYSGNGVGCILAAAISTGQQASDNELTFDSRRDSFEANNQVTPPYAPEGGGLMVFGADSSAALAGRTNRNSVRLFLRDARFADNQNADLIAFGARGANGLVAGTENEVLVVLVGGTQDLVVQDTDSDPAEPTSQVTIVQRPNS